MMKQSAVLRAARLTSSEWTGIIRLASGAAASVLLLATLLNQSLAWSLGEALTITAAWSLAACIVVTWPIRLNGRTMDASGTPSWEHVVWTSVGVGASVSLTLAPPRELPGLLDAVGLALAVTYIGAKGGCCLRGCCSWPTSQQRTGIRRVSLPALELMLTTVLLTGLLLLLGEVAPGRVFGAFFLTHVGARAIARDWRGARPRRTSVAIGGLLGAFFLI